MGLIAGGYMSLHWALFAENVQLFFSLTFASLGMLAWWSPGTGLDKRSSAQPGDKLIAPLLGGILAVLWHGSLSGGIIICLLSPSQYALVGLLCVLGPALAAHSLWFLRSTLQAASRWGLTSRDLPRLANLLSEPLIIHSAAASIIYLVVVYSE